MHYITFQTSEHKTNKDNNARQYTWCSKNVWIWEFCMYVTACSKVCELYLSSIQTISLFITHSDNLFIYHPFRQSLYLLAVQTISLFISYSYNLFIY